MINIGKPAVVMDCGSAYCKVGLKDEPRPRCILPTVIGKPLQDDAFVGLSLKERYVSNEIELRKDMLTLSYPIQHGIVLNWDDMECLWNYIYKVILQAKPETHNLFVAVSANESQQNMEKMIEMAFEKFNVAGFYAGKQPVLALYATGLKTGLVVDCGESCTSIIPVFDSFIIKHGCVRWEIGGACLTKVLKDLIKEKHNIVIEDENILRDMKKKLCYVSLDYEREEMCAVSSFTLEKRYTLPDGSSITLGTERFSTPEVIFQPKLHNILEKGLCDKCGEAIFKCEMELTDTMFSNILLVGGSTLFHGLEERVHKEMIAEAPSHAKVNVYAPALRELLAWIGGSIVSSMPSFQSMWITKKLYKEYGTQVVHFRCF